MLSKQLQPFICKQCYIFRKKELISKIISTQLIITELIFHMHKFAPKIYFYFVFDQHRLLYQSGQNPRASSSDKTVDVYKKIMFVFMSNIIRVRIAIIT